jgi:hypothetical protein
MRALPDITDEPAMLLRGRRSALGSARNEAAEALRDATTMCQSADWNQLAQHADKAAQAADRLKTLAAMWDELC